MQTRLAGTAEDAQWFVTQVELELHLTPICNNVDEAVAEDMQGELLSPAWPINPERHAPQVRAVALHTTLLSEPQSVSTLQSTELMLSVAALMV